MLYVKGSDGVYVTSLETFEVILSVDVNQSSKQGIKILE